MATKTTKRRPAARPAVGLIMGSQSDWSTMRHAAETLEALGVPFEARIISAHRTPKRMMDYASGAKGRGLKVITAGAGGGPHLTAELFSLRAGVKMLHVPYRGTGPMLTDLLAGRLQAAAVGAPALLQFIKAGKLRCIATGTSTRLTQLPDVATVAEQGYKGFEMTQWYGLMAPAATPRTRLIFPRRPCLSWRRRR